MFQPRDRCSGSFWRHVTFGVAIWSHAHDIINGQDLGQSVVFKWDGCMSRILNLSHLHISLFKKKIAKFPMWGFLKKVFLFSCSIHFVQIGFSQSPRTEFPEINRLSKLNPEWEIHHLKMYILLKMVVFHCYVSLLEGKCIHTTISMDCWRD